MDIISHELGTNIHMKYLKDKKSGVQIEYLKNNSFSEFAGNYVSTIPRISINLKSK